MGVNKLKNIEVLNKYIEGFSDALPTWLTYLIGRGDTSKLRERTGLGALKTDAVLHYVHRTLQDIRRGEARGRSVSNY